MHIFIYSKPNHCQKIRENINILMLEKMQEHDFENTYYLLTE